MYVKLLFYKNEDKNENVLIEGLPMQKRAMRFVRVTKDDLNDGSKSTTYCVPVHLHPVIMN